MTQRGDRETEWRRSNPDVVVYIPHGEEYADTDNEHFLVFGSPAGDELLAMWTQSSCEGRGDNHLVLARSSDGVTWSAPEFITGTRPGTQDKQASWGFPVVADTGRIYCLYTREIDLWDASRQGSGAMGCLYSDDCGHTWTPAADIPMPRSRYDNPDPAYPKNWIVWQLPVRDSQGRQLAGYTLCTSPARLAEKPKGWWHWDSRAYFMRFDNIHEGLDPADIEITWLPEDDAGLEVPIPVLPHISAAQEPSIVLLPDGRLFTTLRTFTGHIWYATSVDDGATWSAPEMLRYRDDGPGIEHPLSCCPIYPVGEGRYILLFHNNPGQRLGHDQLELDWKTNHLNFIRNPTFISVGEFRPNAHQPVWFSDPVKLLDTGDIRVGPKDTAEIGTYPSVTHWRGERMLWYPDRKYYLLGKRLPDEFLATLRVPG